MVTRADKGSNSKYMYTCMYAVVLPANDTCITDSGRNPQTDMDCAVVTKIIQLHHSGLGTLLCCRFHIQRGGNPKQALAAATVKLV